MFNCFFLTTYETITSILGLSSVSDLRPKGDVRKKVVFTRFISQWEIFKFLHFIVSSKSLFFSKHKINYRPVTRSGSACSLKRQQWRRSLATNNADPARKPIQLPCLLLRRVKGGGRWDTAFNIFYQLRKLPVYYLL